MCHENNFNKLFGVGSSNLGFVAVYDSKLCVHWSVNCGCIGLNYMTVNYGCIGLYDSKLWAYWSRLYDSKLWVYWSKLYDSKLWVHWSILELRPILPAATPLALLALWLAFLAVTPHAALTNGKAPRS